MAQKRIILGDCEVIPASTEGPTDVFSSRPFILAKLRWMSDEEAQECLSCRQKFTQLRRKHHCRQCGRVLCNKCCNEKVPLPQLALEEPERICEECLPVTGLVTKSRSLQMNFRTEAAKGLAEQVRDPQGLKKVVELGGVQTLIFLSQSSGDAIKGAVADGLHTLSTHPPLHTMLAQSGAIKAICSILSTVSENQEQCLVDGISALKIFCKSEQVKAKALSDGALQPVLMLCAMKEHIALLAIMTLSLIVEDKVNLPVIVEHDKNALPRILTLTKARDEKMQEIALRIVALLSLGTDWQRHLIIQEDFASDQCLAEAVKRKPQNLQVYVNASCLIANLATSEQDQSSLRECLDIMCSVMASHAQHADIQVHVSRALANFAKHKQNSSKLVAHLQKIISVHLKSSNQKVKCHGVRTITNLLGYQKNLVIKELMSNGAADFIDGLASYSGVLLSAQESLIKTASTTEAPM